MQKPCIHVHSIGSSLCPFLFHSTEAALLFSHQELGVKVLMNGDEPMVPVMDGKCKVRLGSRNTAGKQKARLQL